MDSFSKARLAFGVLSEEDFDGKIMELFPIIVKILSDKS